MVWQAATIWARTAVGEDKQQWETFLGTGSLSSYTRSRTAAKLSPLRARTTSPQHEQQQQQHQKERFQLVNNRKGVSPQRHRRDKSPMSPRTVLHSLQLQSRTTPRRSVSPFVETNNSPTLCSVVTPRVAENLARIAEVLGSPRPTDPTGHRASLVLSPPNARSKPRGRSPSPNIMSVNSSKSLVVIASSPQNWREQNAHKANVYRRGQRLLEDRVKTIESRIHERSVLMLPPLDRPDRTPESDERLRVVSWQNVVCLVKWVTIWRAAIYVRHAENIVRIKVIPRLRYYAKMRVMRSSRIMYSVLKIKEHRAPLTAYKKLPVFCQWPQELIRRIVNRGLTWRYRKGSFLMFDGEPSTSLIYLQSGHVEVLLRRNENDKHRSVNNLVPAGRIGPGHFFGETALHNANAVHPANYRCISDVQIWVVTRRTYVSLLRHVPLELRYTGASRAAASSAVGALEGSFLESSASMDLGELDPEEDNNSDVPALQEVQLREHWVFRDWQPGALQPVVESATLLRCRRNQTIITAGHAATFLGVIAKGSLQLQTTSQTDTQLSVGDCLGIDEVLLGGTYIHDVKTVSSCLIWALPAHAVVDALLGDPDEYQNVAALAAEKRAQAMIPPSLVSFLELPIRFASSWLTLDSSSGSSTPGAGSSPPAQVPNVVLRAVHRVMFSHSFAMGGGEYLCASGHKVTALIFVKNGSVRFGRSLLHGPLLMGVEDLMLHASWSQACRTTTRVLGYDVPVKDLLRVLGWGLKDFGTVVREPATVAARRLMAQADRRV
eukprot:PhM_4_TR10496/c0_g1_i1/m.8964